MRVDEALLGLAKLIYPNSTVLPIYDELKYDHFSSAAYDAETNRVTLTLPHYEEYNEAEKPSYNNFNLVHEMAHLLHYQALFPDRPRSFTERDVKQMEAFAFITQFLYCRLLDYFPPANHFNAAKVYYNALHVAHEVYNGAEPDYLLARVLRAVGWMK